MFAEGKPSSYELKKAQQFGAIFLNFSHFSHFSHISLTFLTFFAAKGPMRKKEPRMHIISENPPDAPRLKPKIEGLVSQQYELAPAKESMEHYRKMQGERVKQIGLDRAGRAAASTKLPTSDLGAEHVRKMTTKKADGTIDTSTVGASSSVYNKPAAQKRRDLMVRGDKTDVQDLLFKLFEDNSMVCKDTHTEEELMASVPHISLISLIFLSFLSHVLSRFFRFLSHFSHMSLTCLSRVSLILHSPSRATTAGSTGRRRI